MISAQMILFPRPFRAPARHAVGVHFIWQPVLKSRLYILHVMELDAVDKLA